MLSNLNNLLVTISCLLSVCMAIRVDWNTNTGPIIPPISTPTVRPVPPFRLPAPVWEDLSNDIPNPNPYVYVPPPPSRPKQRLNTNVNYNINGGDYQYGTLITTQNAATYRQQNSPLVPGLAAQYKPNVGTKYAAVVPKLPTIATKLITNTKYPVQTTSNALSPDDKTSYKLHGKYNAKTKKYKAYEKVKYVPNNYVTNATAKASKPLSNKKEQQKLPAKEMAAKFNSNQQGSANLNSSTSLKPNTQTFKKSSTQQYGKNDKVTPNSSRNLKANTEAPKRSFIQQSGKDVKVTLNSSRNLKASTEAPKKSGKDVKVKTRENFTKSINEAKKS